MSTTEKITAILAELDRNSRHLREEQLDGMIKAILGARHIFTAGAGRSGMAIRAFTNRLLHLGFSVSNVGEISSPHSQPGDLVIIGSGSGETDSLVALAKKAVKNGVSVALFTMDDRSSIAQMADAVVVLPGVSKKLSERGMDITSIQPMASAFEQMLFLTCDGIVLELMERMGQTTAEMFTRHADFE